MKLAALATPATGPDVRELPPLPDIPGDGPLCGCGNRGDHVPNVDCDWPCFEPGIWRCTHEACRPS